MSSLSACEAVLELRPLKQIGTSNPHSGVATCQPGSVSPLQHVLFLAYSANKMDKLQALPGVLGKRMQLLSQVLTWD